VTAGVISSPAAALNDYAQCPSYLDQKTSTVSSPQRGLLVHRLAAQSAPPLAPSIELEDVEMTTAPLMVYFRILVRPHGNDAPAHHVMKTCEDLEDLDEALSRELGGGQLQRLPKGRTQKELTETAFCARLGAYLASLSSSLAAVETYSFKNFFQLSDEYQRWLPESSYSSRFGLGDIDEAKRQTLPPAPAQSLLRPAASSSSTASATTQLPAVYGAGSPHALLSSRSQPVERTFLIPDGSPGRALRASQQEAPRGMLLRPAVATVPRAPDMPQTAPDLPRALLPPEEAWTIQAVGSYGNLSSGGAATPAVPSADLSPEAAGPPQRPVNLSQSLQSFSSDEQGSSVETSAGGKRHRRRRPWCVVCLASAQEMAIDPCGHLSMCHRCATVVQACPVCRGPIEKVLRVYVA